MLVFAEPPIALCYEEGLREKLHLCMDIRFSLGGLEDLRVGTPRH